MDSSWDQSVLKRSGIVNDTSKTRKLAQDVANEKSARNSCKGQMRTFVEGNGKSPFICQVCWRNFASEKYLSMHMSIHKYARTDQVETTVIKTEIDANSPEFRQLSEDTLSTCPICKKTFGQNSNYKNHMKTHSDERPFICDVCSIGFKERYHLKKHILFKHTTDLKESCRVCGKQFKDSTAVRAHERIHSEERPYRCELCAKTFKTSECLWHHENRSKTCGKSVHQKQVDENVKVSISRFTGMKPRLKLIRDSNYIPQKIFSSDEFLIPGNSFVSFQANDVNCVEIETASVEIATEMVKSEIVSALDLSCGFPPREWCQQEEVCEDDDDAIIDIETSSPSNFASEIKNTTQHEEKINNSNKKHRTESLPSPTKSLTTPTKSLTSPTKSLTSPTRSLTSPMEKHDRPYTCLTCSNSFKLKVHLKKHILYRHSNEYPCECSICGKRFKDMSAVHLHERIHSNDRPFRCQCGKNFKTRENLWGHRNRSPCGRSEDFFTNNIRLFRSQRYDQILGIPVNRTSIQTEVEDCPINSFQTMQTREMISEIEPLHFRHENFNENLISSGRYLHLVLSNALNVSGLTSDCQSANQATVAASQSQIKIAQRILLPMAIVVPIQRSLANEIPNASSNLLETNMPESNTHNSAPMTIESQGFPSIAAENCPIVRKYFSATANKHSQFLHISSDNSSENLLYDKDNTNLEKEECKKSQNNNFKRNDVIKNKNCINKTRSPASCSANLGENYSPSIVKNEIFLSDLHPWIDPEIPFCPPQHQPTFKDPHLVDYPGVGSDNDNTVENWEDGERDDISLTTAWPLENESLFSDLSLVPSMGHVSEK